MATGGSASIQGASDALCDFNCSLCELDKLNNRAKFYCGQCSQVLCNTCEKFHGMFHASHQVLGRRDKSKWGEVKGSVSLLTCEEHNHEEIKMICREHDRVFCSVCASQYHRACKKVEYIPAVAKGVKQMRDFKDLPEKASKVTTTLREALRGRKKVRKSLQKSCQGFMDTLNGIQRNFSERIEEIKKATIEDMDQLMDTLDQTIQSEVDAIMKLNEGIEEYVKIVKEQEKHNDATAFIGYKKCEEKLSEVEDLLHKIKGNKYKLKFEPDDTIRQCMASARSLGKFHSSTQPRHVRLSRSSLKVNSSKKVRVRSKKDKSTCYIQNLCQLPSGHLVAVDSANENVKLLNDQFTVIDVYMVHEYPQHLCVISDDEVAVTVNCTGKRHEVHFLTIQNDRIVLKRKFAVNHDCVGILHSQSTLYIASVTALYSYTMDGYLIKKLYEDKSSYLTVGSVSMSTDGSKFFLRNINTNQIYTLDNDGTRLSTSTFPDMKEPNNIIFTDDGSVLFSWRDRHIILLLDSKRNKTVATAADGLNEPCCVLFDRKASRLLVGQYNTDELLALQLG